MPPPAFSHRSEAQRTGAYASPLHLLRPCWTAFLIILLVYRVIRPSVIFQQRVMS